MRYEYFCLIYLGVLFIAGMINSFILNSDDIIMPTVFAMGTALFWAIETKK